MNQNKPSTDYLAITLGFLAFVVCVYGLLAPEFKKEKQVNGYKFQTTRAAFSEGFKK